jgi:hypothetical protein
MFCSSRSLLLALTAWLAVLSACSGQSLKDPDGDESRTKARPFARLEPTDDKLDAAAGDQEDWRFILPEQKGKMELRISLGKWEESTIVGFVTVFTEVGDRVAEKPIPPGSAVTIKLEFEVEPDMRYLVRFKATSGKGKYAVEVGEASDPCAACTPQQECVDQKCVDKACGGDCPEDSACDKATNKCVKTATRPENKCEGVTCPRGQVCVRATGRCVTPAAKEPTPTPTPAVPEVEDINCTVIDARDSGGGSFLTLSAGDNKEVKKGMTGSVKGLKGSSFTIVEVYPFRSKATSKLPPTAFAGNTSAVIRR